MTTDTETTEAAESYDELGQAPLVGATAEGCNDPRINGHLFRVDKTNPRTCTCTDEAGRAHRIDYGLLRPTSRTFTLVAAPQAEAGRLCEGAVVTADALAGRGKWTYRAGTKFAVIAVNDRTYGLAKLGGGDGKRWTVSKHAVKVVGVYGAGETCPEGDIDQFLVV